MDATPPRIPWAAVAVRIAGLYVLTGALLKLFLGTPADLPIAIRRLPLGLGDLFRIVIAVETFVALLAVFRPARGWISLALLLLAFAGVLAMQVAEGAASCGCFGPSIDIPPSVALSVDVALLVLVVTSRPWRLSGHGARDWAFAAGLLAVAVALPLVFDREGKASVGRPYETLEMEKWPGKRLADTKLAGFTDLSHAEDGLWFFYSETCPVCADCLWLMRGREVGEREVTLVRLSKPPDPNVKPAVHDMPSGPFVHHIDLPDTVDWMLNPPVEVIVKDGKVVSVRNLTPEDCR